MKSRVIDSAEKLSKNSEHEEENAAEEIIK